MSQNTNMTTAIKMTAAMPSFMHRAKYMNMNLKISLNDGNFMVGIPSLPCRVYVLRIRLLVRPTFQNRGSRYATSHAGTLLSALDRKALR